MQPSMFNTRAAIPDRDETFLLNTLTEARLLVSNDVVDLLDRVDGGSGPPSDIGDDARRYQ